jgi:ABC-type nickel/cobalt efflux system permease component RcnA/ABC-type uncharacterized transport system substrate-binding protein
MKYLATILILLIFPQYSQGCPLCRGESTKTLVTIDISSNEFHLKKLQIKWQFDAKYSRNLIQSMDSNGDQQLKGEEAKKTEIFLNNSFRFKHHNLKLEYTPTDKRMKAMDFIPVKAVNSTIRQKDDVITYLFEIPLDLEIKPFWSLCIIFRDLNFMFKYQIVEAKISNPHYEINMDLDNHFVFCNIKNRKGPISEKSSSSLAGDIKINHTISGKVRLKNQNSDDDNQMLNQGPYGFFPFLVPHYKKTSWLIKDYLRKTSEDLNFYSYIFLILFSSTFGFLHALGPGHGKSIVTSYFLTAKFTYSRALTVTVLISLVHILSSFIFAVIIFYTLKFAASGLFLSYENTVIKITGIIILIIGVYLLYRKVKNGRYGSEHDCCGASCQHHHRRQTSEYAQIGLIFSAGMVPCVGTLGVFLFAFSIGYFWLGAISAIFMTLGMAIVLLASAVFSISIKTQLEKRFSRAVVFLEYSSLVMIVLLGIVILLP